jgi:hypothetical protein
VIERPGTKVSGLFVFWRYGTYRMACREGDFSA